MVDRSGATAGSGGGSGRTAPALTPETSVSSNSGSDSPPGATGSLLIPPGLCQEPKREPEKGRQKEPKNAPVDFGRGAEARSAPSSIPTVCLALEPHHDANPKMVLVLPVDDSDDRARRGLRSARGQEGGAR